MAIFYLDPEDGNDSITDTPLGWWRVSVTVTGGSAPSADATMTGATSGATAKLTIAPASWSGTVMCYFYGKSGTFVSENVSFTGGGTGTISSDLQYCAWKTFNNGATAARIAPGDTIRIKKSPEPIAVGTYTWGTANTPNTTIDIPDGTVKIIDACDSGWVGVSGTTVSHSATNRKEGTNLVSIATGSVTGKVAYKTISSADFSSYQQVSFWLRANAQLTSSHGYRICLCSDTAGNTIVDDLSFPADGAGNVNGAADYWIPIAINKGSALGSSIQSVAIYRTTNVSHTILLDNIIACKSVSDNSSITLQTIIGLNGDDTCWYPIMNITQASGKQVIRVDSHTNNVLSSLVNKGYIEGIGGSQVTYKINTFKYNLATATDIGICNITKSGTPDAIISYEGGYSNITNAKEWYTFFDGLNSRGYGINIGGYRSNISIKNICPIRYNFGFYSYRTIANVKIYCEHVLANVIGIMLAPDISSNNSLLYVEIKNFNNNGTGISINNSVLFGYIKNILNNNTGIFIASSAIDITADNINNSYSHGISIQYISLGFLRNATVSNSGTSSISSNCGILNLYNCMLNDSTEISYTFSGGYIYSTKHDQTSNNHYILTPGAYVRSQTSVRHTESGIAWQCYFSSTSRTSAYPVEFPIAKIACASGSEVTAKIWARRSSTSVTGNIICRANQIGGVASDVIATITANADTWEELSISFTPTESGVVEIIAQCYGNGSFTGASVYFDDFSVSQ